MYIVFSGLKTDSHNPATTGAIEDAIELLTDNSHKSPEPSTEEALDAPNDSSPLKVQETPIPNDTVNEQTFKVKSETSHQQEKQGSLAGEKTDSKSPSVDSEFKTAVNKSESAKLGESGSQKQLSKETSVDKSGPKKSLHKESSVSNGEEESPKQPESAFASEKKESCGVSKDQKLIQESVVVANSIANKTRSSSVIEAEDKRKAITAQDTKAETGRKESIKGNQIEIEPCEVEPQTSQLRRKSSVILVRRDSMPAPGDEMSKLNFNKPVKSLECERKYPN